MNPCSFESPADIVNYVELMTRLGHMKPKRNPDIETKMLPDGHVVIFSKKSDWAHTITPLAAIAWEFCDGEHSLEDIVSCVRDCANLNEGAANSNLKPAISDLLNDFAKSGLVQNALS